MAKGNGEEKKPKPSKKPQTERSPTRTRRGTARPSPSRGGGKRGGKPQNPPGPKAGKLKEPQ